MKQVSATQNLVLFTVSFYQTWDHQDPSVLSSSPGPSGRKSPQGSERYILIIKLHL